MSNLPTLSQKQREIYYSDDYRPAEELLGEDFPNWYVLEHIVPSDKKLQVFLNYHTHNIPIVSHAYVFRWIMPEYPNLYSADDRYDPTDRKVGLYRFTPGEQFVVTEEEIKDIATGKIQVDQSYLDKLNYHLQNSFVFNALKIPMLDMRVDEIVESEFEKIFDLHNGKTSQEAKRVLDERKKDQEIQKSKLLEDVKGKLREFPDYLSILRRLVSKEIDIEQAQQAGSGIFTKGI